MNCIQVNTGTPYQVLIRRGILQDAGEEVKKVKPYARLAVVTDSNVSPLYLRNLLDSLERAGYKNILSFTMAAGEDTKSLGNAGLLYQLLSQAKISRDCCLIALGGGVIGDLTGFVASTYLRGIPYIQIPTTLLAQVDSSVGGKTAVNLSTGKNLVGTFWQPSLVLCDPDTLSTLPQDVFADGIAEAIKCGMIRDSVLFDLLAHQDPQDYLEEIISRCISIKRDVVEKDEHDTGERMLLNFGHTLAHTIEQHFHYERESHGEAVGIGMYQITKIAEEKNLCQPGTAMEIQRLLKSYGLPDACNLPMHVLTDAISLDKKNLNNHLNLVLLHQIGESYVYPADLTFFDHADEI